VTPIPAANCAGHSLRAGFATQAAAGGVPLDRIMRQTQHHSVAVALRYIRQTDVWQNNPSAALGLQEKPSRRSAIAKCSSGYSGPSDFSMGHDPDPWGWSSARRR
jgi:hypothetical protein